MIDYNGKPPQNCDCDCDHGTRYEKVESSIMLAVALNLKKNPEFMGLVDHGGTQFTVPIKVINADGAFITNDIWEVIDKNDIIVAKDRTRKANDYMKRGVRDTLHAYSVTKLLRVLYNNSVIPSSQYTWDLATKTITWIAGGTDIPPVNSRYLVEFIENINYRVFVDVGMRRGSKTEHLPIKVIAIQRSYTLDEKTIDLTNVTVLK